MKPAELYKGVLMDHYWHPRNQQRVEGADAIGCSFNPLCGDEVEVGVDFRDGLLEQVRFWGRGCSLCVASASMMTETVTGKSRAEALRLSATLRQWFTGDPETPVPDLPGPLTALSAARELPARRRCVLLAWEALDDALASR